MTMIERLFFSWESQASQYPLDGPPGVISYFAGDVGAAEPVDCLLWRDGGGVLVGILNHYPIDYPPLERAGNFLVFVREDQRLQGIGSALLDEARRRWTIDLTQQLYTVDGHKFITHYVRHRERLS